MHRYAVGSRPWPWVKRANLTDTLVHCPHRDSVSVSRCVTPRRRSSQAGQHQPTAFSRGEHPSRYFPTRFGSSFNSILQASQMHVCNWSLVKVAIRSCRTRSARSCPTTLKPAERIVQQHWQDVVRRMCADHCPSHICVTLGMG
jgi:hypothetical protein